MLTGIWMTPVVSELGALEAYQRGAYNHVPAILGGNRDEQRLFNLMTSAHVRRLFQIPLGMKNLRMYEVTSDYASRAWKALGVDEPATSMRAQQGASVYAYRFDWDHEPGFLWLDLARWLVDDGHPLTSRVVVNRFFDLFFGRGLAPVLDDLGAQGGAPSHPELLDALAGRYLASGWDTKELIRTLVSSGRASLARSRCSSACARRPSSSATIPRSRAMSQGASGWRSAEASRTSSSARRAGVSAIWDIAWSGVADARSSR